MENLDPIISDNLLNFVRSDNNAIAYHCINDKNFTFTKLSSASLELTGYTHKELEGAGNNSLLKLAFDKDSELIKNRLKQFSVILEKDNTDSPYKTEYRIVCKTKKLKWVQDTCLPVRNNAGYITHFSGFITDINYIKALEKTAVTLNSFQNAVDGSSIVSMADISGKIIYVNENFCKYSKYSVAELLGKNHNIVNSGKHDKLFFTQLWKTITSGKIWRGEICNKAKDGSLYWVDTVITPVKGDDNKIDHYLSIRNVITDKINLKEQLLASEERLKTIIDSVNEVIYTISVDGKFISLNKAFEKITGFKVEQWINRSFAELVHPDDLALAGSNFHKTLADVFIEPYELRILNCKGEYRICEVTPSRLKKDGKVVAALGTARDISERKKHENKLKNIYLSVSVKTGLNYFSNLTEYCCTKLGFKYALIGVFNSGTNTINTISFRNKNVEIQNFNFNIVESPFEKIIGYERFIFQENIQKLFPKDTMLKKFDVFSCMGYPLVDQSNKVLGVLALMDDSPITDLNEKEENIVFFLDRTANEISRELAEKKVKQSEEFNKDILSALNSHLAVLNEEGEIIAVNDAWTKFALRNGSNEPLHTGIGSNYFEVCERAFKSGDAIAGKALDGIRSVMFNNVKRFQMEYPCHSLIEERWFVLSVTKLSSNENHVVVNHTNISDRKLIEERLISNETRYRTLIENSQEMIFSVNVDGDFTFANHQFLKSLQYSEKELKSLNLFQLISEESLPDCSNHFKKVLTGERNKNINTVFISKKRKKIYALGNSTPIIFNEEVIGIQSFFTDITQEKIAEEKLGKSEERYKYLVENINDAIVVKNLLGKTIYANKRFFDLLGYNEKEFHELKISDYISKNWQSKIKKYYSDLIAGKSVPNVFEYQCINNKGELRWLEDKPTLLFAGKKIIGTQTIIRDITEIKNKEIELNKLISDLTDKNNEMMQFNYIVSHNLRSPIANILGLSNLLETEKISGEDRTKILKHIKDSSLKMDEIVKDLSLVLNTKTNLNAKKEKVFLHTILHGITETLHIQITKSNCQIVTKIASNANEFISIKSYIESILFNLISNAIKYRSPTRILTIKISAKKTNNKIILKVEDNGLGFNLKEHGSYVFGLYKRFNFEVEGKGLGLHMTKNQVESLGGTINLESELDKGSVFTITLNT